MSELVVPEVTGPQELVNAQDSGVQIQKFSRQGALVFKAFEDIMNMLPASQTNDAARKVISDERTVLTESNYYYWRYLGGMLGTEKNVAEQIQLMMNVGQTVKGPGAVAFMRHNLKGMGDSMEKLRESFQESMEDITRCCKAGERLSSFDGEQQTITQAFNDAIQEFSYKAKAEYLLSDDFNTELKKLQDKRDALDEKVKEHIMRLRVAEGEKMRLEGEEIFCKMIADGEETDLKAMKARVSKWCQDEQDQAKRAAESVGPLAHTHLHVHYTVFGIRFWSRTEKLEPHADPQEEERLKLMRHWHNYYKTKANSQQEQAAAMQKRCGELKAQIQEAAGTIQTRERELQENIEALNEVKSEIKAHSDEVGKIQKLFGGQPLKDVVTLNKAMQAMPRMLDSKSGNAGLFAGAKKHVEGHLLFIDRLQGINIEFSQASDDVVKNLLSYVKPVIADVLKRTTFMLGNLEDVHHRTQITLQMANPGAAPQHALQDATPVTKEEIQEAVTESADDEEDVW